MNKNQLLKRVLNQQIQIFQLLKPAKLASYQYTQEKLFTTDVSADRNYQRKYTGFYKLRLPHSSLYPKHFSILQNQKNNPNVAFETIFHALSEATGRMEASFSSKLLATVNPHRPPLDRIVLGHLGLTMPKGKQQHQAEYFIELYEQVNELMGSLIKQDAFQEIKSSFKHTYPQFEFSDMKILDIYLWALRV